MSASSQRIHEVLAKLRERLQLLPKELQAEKERDMVKYLEADVFGARLGYRRICSTGTKEQRWEYLLDNTSNSDATFETELAIFRRLYS
jgi:hypothetical protein